MSVQQVQLELDSNVRRVSHGTALLGGSPFRVMRLSKAGAKLLDGWLAGGELPASGSPARLLERLISAGMVHPLHPLPSPIASSAVAVVVPVLDDVDGARRAVAAANVSGAQVVVVDDGSQISVGEVTGAEVIRHDRNAGPAAARNTGWRHARDRGAEAVVFIDADVVASPGAIETMLAHFADPSVAAVAARVQAERGATTIARYEATNSALDLGADPALVVPGSRISYVPSAALAVRTSALETLDGFDESFRYGEDVDFVWRLHDRGFTVRYEPRAVVTHRNRGSLAAFARQRFSYGSSAAQLGERHADKIAPLQLPLPPVVSTLALALGAPIVKLLGLAVAVAAAFDTRRRIGASVDEPVNEAARLSLLGHRYAAQGLANATTRTWAPLLLLHRRSRRWLAAAFALPALIDWIRRRPSIDPLSHLALRGLDHGAYCAGVWAGMLRGRSLTALLPRVRLRQRQEPAGD